MLPSALLLILAVTAASIPSLTVAGTQKVLSIVEIVDSTFHLNSTNLNQILDKVPPNVEVGVIAIAGEYRQGKSFLLNFFLQYLEYRVQTTTVPKVIAEDDLPEVISKKSHPWLRDVEKNSGFQFKSGYIRETTGINIWSEPFLIKCNSGQQLALLVMDSQGLYDKETSADDNVRLFTMVSMLSSLLMFNVKSNINSNQLKELQYFLNYASSGTVTGTHKSFQALTFLIRDFTLGDDLGWEAGQDVLNNFMSPESDDSHPEIKEITESLLKGFQKLNAFAMPGPGNRVTRKDYDGSLMKIDTMFLEQLQSLIIETVETVAPKNDRLNNLTATEFFTYTQGLVQAFNKKLSPGELNRLMEKKLRDKITDDIDKVWVKKYAAQITDYVEKMNISKFTGKSDDLIKAAIDRKHKNYTTVMMHDFSTLSISKVNVRLSSDNKPVTALQYLEDKINQEYAQISQQLVELAIENKKKLEIKQIKSEITELVTKYMNQMMDYVRKKPDSYFEPYPSERIKSEIGSQHKQQKEAFLAVFSKLPQSNYTTTITVGTKKLTSSQFLTNTIEEKFAEIFPNLFNDALQKRDRCALKISDQEDLGKEYCCPLVWKKLVNDQFIPRDAVQAGTSKYGSKTYYTGLNGEWWDPVSPDKIGVVSELNPRIAYYERNNKAYTYNGRCITAMTGKKQDEGCPYKEIFILSNPFNCTLNWWKRESKREMPFLSKDKLFPNLGSKYLARRKYRSYTGAGVVDFKTNGNVGDYHEVYNGDVWNYGSSGTEIPYIDCDASFPNIIQVELLNLDFDISPLIYNKKNVSLASTIIDNSKGSTTQTSKVTLTARKMEQLSITYETTFVNKLKIEMPITVGVPLVKLLNLTMGLRVTDEIQKLAKTGTMNLKTTESTFSFEQEIAVPAHTIMRVDIMTMPIQGTVPFVAKYVLKSDAFRSSRAIIAAVEHQGLKVPSNHTLDGDNVIFTLEGKMSIESGYGTHVFFTETNKRSDVDMP